MDELDSKLRNLEELEAARAKEAWEKHVVSTPFWYIPLHYALKPGKMIVPFLRGRNINWFSEHCA